MLHEGVGREGKALFVASLGIELDEVAGDVFHLALGLLLHAFPGARPQFADAGRFTLLGPVFGQFVQGVYVDEENVVVLIDEFDDLLHGAVELGTEQPAELAHAVVDVHDVVAYLELAQLFERQRQFARAGLFAAQPVFVESVEELVVGKEAEVQFVVDESLVQGFVDGGEGDVFAFVLENVGDALRLFLAVAQDIERVALVQQRRERFAHEVEILVVDGLRRAVQRQGRTRLSVERLVAVVDAFEVEHAAGKLVDVDKFLAGMQVALLGDEQLLRDGVGGDAVHAFEHPGQVFHREHRMRVDDLQQRDARLGTLLQVGNDGNLLDGLLRKLRVDVERPYALYFIAESVDAEGQV